MRPTFEIVAGIISQTCDVPCERITPYSNLLTDLGVDSLDLLDVAFAIDDAFGIAVPLDRWLNAVNIGSGSSDEYFVMQEFCDNIDALVVSAAACPEQSSAGL